MSYEDSSTRSGEYLTLETHQYLAREVDKFVQTFGNTSKDGNWTSATVTPDDSGLEAMGFAPGGEDEPRPTLTITAPRNGAVTGTTQLSFRDFLSRDPYGRLMPMGGDSRTCEVLVEPNGLAYSSRPDISPGEGDGQMGFPPIITPYTETEALKLAAYLERTTSGVRNSFRRLVKRALSAVVSN